MTEAFGSPTGGSGSIREPLGAIRNLEQLLRSLKVGPKALTGVIPDVQASCAPLRDALRAVLSQLAERSPLGASALQAFSLPIVDELDAALSRVLGTTVNARIRLQLEEVVTRTVASLDAARLHIELLEVASSGVSTMLELSELVSAASATSAGLEIPVNPRAALGLLGLSGALVRQHSPSKSPQVRLIERPADGRPGVRIVLSTSPDPAVRLVMLPIIDPSVAVAEDVAKLLGARFHMMEDPPEVRITWDPRTSD